MGRITSSNFTRTKQFQQPTTATKSTTPMGQALGYAPPPMRSMTYPVLVEASPTAKPQVRSCDSPSSPFCSPLASPKSTKSQSLMGRTASAPGFQPPVSPLASKVFSPQRTRSSSGFAMASMESREVCEELDCFEQTMQERPRISNFYDPPQKNGSRGSPLPS